MANKHRFIYYISLIFILLSGHAADSTPSSDSQKSNNINSEQIVTLEGILKSLTPEGYSFKILNNQHNPYRWSSSGDFSGITFYFDSNGPQHSMVPLSEGEELRTSVYITFMPEEYVGVSLHDNDSALQVPVVPSKYLGKYQTLQVYGCSTFGYSLPKKGQLSEDNLRKTIGIVWDETRCITTTTTKDFEKIVKSILPEDYTIEVGGGTDPYHWSSTGTSIGVTFYLQAKNNLPESGEKIPTTILTIMPPAYNGKPLPPIISKGIYNVGTKKYDPEVQVEILSATYLGNWNSLKFYASVGWGHPLPKQGVLSEDIIIKAFNLSMLEKTTNIGIQSRINYN